MMDNQTYFDAAIAHIRNQPTAAHWLHGDVEDDVFTAHRAWRVVGDEQNEAQASPLGSQISPDIYDPAMEEVGSVAELMEAYPALADHFAGVDLELIEALEELHHGHAAARDMEARGLAERFGLRA